MVRSSFLLSVTLGLCCPFLSAAPADENWPGWRGPRGDGSSLSTGVPTAFRVPEDVVWKTELPGLGHASPIVWDERVFTVSARADDQSRLLLCLDRGTGEILWERVVLHAPMEDIHQLNSHASSTPATDGEHVYVSFLDRDQMFVAAYDFDGNMVWETRPGPFASVHGYCSSPVLWNGKVIVNGDHDGDGFLVALDAASGDIVWKTARPNHTRSYCTPIIREIDGRTQMVLSGSLCVASYDPDTGAQHWIMDGPTEQFVASLVYNGDLLFLTAGFPEKHMLAIRPDGSGDVTDTHVAWRSQKGAAYVPSPLAVGPHFVVVSDGGVATCFVATSGEELWQERLPGRHSASGITANGLAYFLSDRGTLSVIKPGPTFNVIAQSELGEPTDASPAVSGNHLILRSENHLWCLKQGTQSTAATSP